MEEKSEIRVKFEIGEIKFPLLLSEIYIPKPKSLCQII